MADAEHLKILEQGVEVWNNWRKKEKKAPDLVEADLSGRDLTEMDFSGANLSKANLSETNITNAKFIKANLQKSNLSKSKGSNVNFKESNLTDAILQEVIFDECILFKVQFIRTKLGNSKFFRSLFMFSKFEKVEMHNSTFTNNDFSNCSIIELSAKFVNFGFSQFNYGTIEDSFLINSSFNDVFIIEGHFYNCSLSGSDFKRAIITNSEIINCDLFDTSFQDADLQDTKFIKNKNLTGNQFGGSNLSGVELPQTINKFETLKYNEESSKSTQKLFFTMFLIGVYFLLTIFTTSDSQLLTNSASFQIPILGATVHIVNFYIFSALLSLGIFVYFYLYLQRSWEVVVELPAMFPDGKPLDQRLNPWLINTLIRSHFPLLIKSKLPLYRIQKSFIIFLTFWFIPIILVISWLRYLPRHDLIISILQIIIITCSFFSALFFQNLTKITLSGKSFNPIAHKFWKDKRLYLRIITFTLLLLFFCTITYGSIYGIPCDSPSVGFSKYDAVERPKLKRYDVRYWVPILLSKIGFSSFAFLVETDVSDRSNVVPGFDFVSQVKGAHLANSDLRYAFARRAFLVNADLREADLKGAFLTLADMRGSKLGNANLKNANLAETDLRKSDLRNVNFENANLSGAKLEGALNLTVDQLSKAKTLYNVRLDDKILEEIKENFPQLLLEPDENN